jgi:hypothetical protein
MRFVLNPPHRLVVVLEAHQKREWNAAVGMPDTNHGRHAQP